MATIQRLRAVGVGLVVIAIATLVVGGLAIFGDPYPVSRVGVAADSNGLVVVNAVCPGERLIEVRLRRWTGEQSVEEAWRIEGDGALPTRFPIGEALDGMRTVVEFDDSVRPGDVLDVRVVTDDLARADPWSPAPMDFRPRDVPTTGVLSFGVVYPTYESFAQAVEADTPCGDPASKNGAFRFRAVAWIVGAVVGLTGAVLLVGATWRRDKRAVNPGGDGPTL